jgi:hypothetical protein
VIAAALAHHQHAGGDAGAVEQVGGQADHRFQQVGLDHRRADGAFLAAAEQHAVRHHGGDHAAVARHRDHVLQEHQVGLLAAQRHLAVAEALRELRAKHRLAVAVGFGGAPVDRERRIGEHAVEAHQLAAFHVLRLGQGVVVAQIGAADAVQQHVHLGDGPHRAVGLLPAQVGARAVATVLVDVLLGQDQHAARAHARVVDAVLLLRLDQPHHHPHHRARRVELAALLAGRVRELADQVLVGRAEQVRELEVLVAQPVVAEMADQLAQLDVRDLALAHLAREVDVLQHLGQAGVVALQPTQRLVQKAADIVVRSLTR